MRILPAVRRDIFMLETFKNLCYNPMYCLGTVYNPTQFGDIVVKAMVLQFYGKLIKKQDNNY